MWIHLLLTTGIRLSAALALTDADVDLERGEILVRHAKGDRVEIVFLGREIRDHLVGYLAERPPGPLFPGRDGRPIGRRHASRRLEIWIHRAGCRGPASPHCLRHSFALALYSRTGDVLLVQQALGHAAITSTMVYARADAGRLREAMAG
jgi:integrase